MDTKNMDVYEIRTEKFYSKPRKRYLLNFAYKATNEEIFKCVAIDREFAMIQLKKWIKEKRLFDNPL